MTGLRALPRLLRPPKPVGGIWPSVPLSSVPSLRDLFQFTRSIPAQKDLSPAPVIFHPLGILDCNRWKINWDWLTTIHQISSVASAQSSNADISKLASGFSALYCLGRLIVISRTWGSGTESIKYFAVGSCIVLTEEESISHHLVMQNAAKFIGVWCDSSRPVNMFWLPTRWGAAHSFSDYSCLYVASLFALISSRQGLYDEQQHDMWFQCKLFGAFSG